LERVVNQLGVPVSITVDHGTEFMPKALEEWTWRREMPSAQRMGDPAGYAPRARQ